jgi:hypothetical protein
VVVGVDWALHRFAISVDIRWRAGGVGGLALCAIRGVSHQQIHVRGNTSELERIRFVRIKTTQVTTGNEWNNKIRKTNELIPWSISTRTRRVTRQREIEVDLDLLVSLQECCHGRNKVSWWCKPPTHNKAFNT